MSIESRFREDERQLISDREFFERKLAITEKIRDIYSDLRGRLKEVLRPEAYLAPPGVDYTQGKLSGGEHHFDLPYIFLDFPRLFSRSAIFAYRSIFWWGHHFLFSLILSGDLLPDYRERFLLGMERLLGRGDFLAISLDPWEWRGGEENVQAIIGANRAKVVEALRQHPFLKLIRFIPFDHPSLSRGNLAEEGVQAFLAWEFIFCR